MTLAGRATSIAASLPPLALRAERLARLIMQGNHPRGRPGSGYNFWQYRRYSPSDAATLIDWRRSGRSQRLYVREMEWETSQSLWLWVDSAKGMDFNSHQDLDRKLDRARLIAIVMGLLAREGGEQVALAGRNLFSDHGHVLADRLYRAFDRLSLPVMEHDDDFALPADLTPPRNSHMLVISDFMARKESLEAGLSRLAQRGIQAQLVQVLDPIEIDFPFEGRMRFLHPATHEYVEIGESRAVAADYRQRLAQRQDFLQQTARKYGWHWHMHNTSTPPEKLALALYAVMRDQGGLQR